jgi:hypothetical protein
VGHGLLVKALLQLRKHGVEVPGLDDWPGNDVHAATVKSRNEVGFLLLLDDLLELQAEPLWRFIIIYQKNKTSKDSLFRDLARVGVHYILNHVRQSRRQFGALSMRLTLMMITSVERKRSGFVAGSRTVDEDWKDWNSPVMSRERAKLLRKRTC